MITLIDNYDSFTFNLFHELSKKDEVQIFKNDEIKKNFLKIIKSKAVVISPGPSNPFNSGDCLDLVNKIYSFMPILGVCLGHQILGVYFGIKIKVLKIPKHGKISTIKINKNCKIYNNVEKTFKATRYHSLYLEKENFPKNLEITSQSTDDKVLMSFKHKIYPIYGVQYHPESIETSKGSTILKNFIDIL
jgi:anthranilate synthase/aminodeoxychorismate synthase-like glutamine amidotransferase|tara:strand:- start:2043 stop:2612 length:570 start_codon:yes stop_codon:yes gene_type:complete